MYKWYIPQYLYIKYLMRVSRVQGTVHHNFPSTEAYRVSDQITDIFTLRRDSARYPWCTSRLRSTQICA